MDQSPKNQLILSQKVKGHQRPKTQNPVTKQAPQTPGPPRDTEGPGSSSSLSVPTRHPESRGEGAGQVQSRWGTEAPELAPALPTRNGHLGDHHTGHLTELHTAPAQVASVLEDCRPHARKPPVPEGLQTSCSPVKVPKEWEEEVASHQVKFVGASVRSPPGRALQTDGAQNATAPPPCRTPAAGPVLCAMVGSSSCPMTAPTQGTQWLSTCQVPSC